MSTTLILGDLHLDKNFPYTAPESDKALAITQFKRGILDSLISSADDIVQTGDMFDSHDATGYHLLSALELFKGKPFTFPLGNHDVSKRRLPSASALLKERFAYALPDWEVVDHRLTQELFDAAIQGLTGGEYLVLHCGVGSPQASHENWITEAQLEKLSHKYKFIFIGHEHKFQQLHDNVVIVGTPYPVDFGEMYDHYAILLNDRGDVEVVKTFDVEKMYSEVDVNDPVVECRPFLKLVGTVDSANSKHAFQKLKEIRLHPSTLSVKPAFSVVSQAVQEAKSTQWVDFGEALKAVMTDDMRKIYDEIMGDTNEI